MRYRVVEEFGLYSVDILKDERDGRHGSRLWPKRGSSTGRLDMIDAGDDVVLEDLFK